MICKFCRVDIEAARTDGLIVVTCTEHNCPVCPRCYGCQNAEGASPQTPDQWQEAVDTAEFVLAIDNCRRSGLIATSIEPDLVRCRQILALGRELGVTPRPIAELCNLFIGERAL